MQEAKAAVDVCTVQEEDGGLAFQGRVSINSWDCAVCKKFLSKNIWQCPNGHITCCVNSAAACFCCGRVATLSRPLMAARELVVRRCPYAPCLWTGLEDGHVASCERQPVNCSRCGGRTTYHEYHQHRHECGSMLCWNRSGAVTAAHKAALQGSTVSLAIKRCHRTFMYVESVPEGVAWTVVSPKRHTAGLALCWLVEGGVRSEVLPVNGPGTGPLASVVIPKGEAPTRVYLLGAELCFGPGDVLAPHQIWGNSPAVVDSNHLGETGVIGDEIIVEFTPAASRVTKLAKVASDEVELKYDAKLCVLNSHHATRDGAMRAVRAGQANKAASFAPRKGAAAPEGRRREPPS